MLYHIYTVFTLVGKHIYYSMSIAISRFVEGIIYDLMEAILAQITPRDVDMN